ncbi:Inner membrane ABC transporter permease protein ycjP [Sebaldella termitidis]|uniref:Binding-protein-dependent transport systems inner membrane component n=1 Tax=Sebaldella termitidis (strain ATCC 33386 / NCTC 11300) TaxID=526218 RepID=D1APZ3_SEBTE|nr:carbohydrate ABC transporter permease [Sebaldella termitidis]ACZ07571.1 binding-protein-dependent transport systems inner membrane component [Sebaldella termitidis ATCC 33386]MBP7979432.1 carbohydrate ABC transporter permease [Sebaldella sp.]SUI22867.1 Inner membrane ABC transporter permease protein ycjP [Sebaldella termitidis]
MNENIVIDKDIVEMNKKRLKKMKMKNTVNSAVRYSVLIIVGFIMLYPLLWMIGSSFKTNAEIFSSVGFIPKSLNFDNYVKGWETSTEYSFTTYFINTFKILVPKVFFTIISTVITAYAFARFKIPGKKILFGILIGTLLLPEIVVRIPQYLIYKQFGWLDTYLPLIVPSAFGVDAFFVFMLVQFFRGIPKDLEEAAEIDGCNTFQTLIYVLVPVLKPAIISVALFQFMWTMNDFMSPLIYLSSVEKYPVSIALKISMDASAAVEWNKILAMSVIVLLPSLIIFFFAQKYFVDGVSSSGLKE